MPDMLVRLYDLPPAAAMVEQLAARGVTIRRAIPSERPIVLGWVEKTFGAGWAAQCEVSMSHFPVTCFIAVDENEKRVIGFACHEATCKAFFGPTGVAETERGRGVGKALLLTTLHDMRACGYGYGIIGAAGPVDFYNKLCGAVPIADSEPGIYRGALRSPPAQ
ncbi:MAG: GNAT family N-acetyltransferase [Phycisphaerales bacterium]